MRHLIVDQGHTGSIPVHRAKFREHTGGKTAGATGVSSKWPGSLSFKQRMRDRAPPPLPKVMTCKGCGKQCVTEEEGQLGLCPGCWEELCDLSLWQKFDAVAEGAD